MSGKKGIGDAKSRSGAETVTAETTRNIILGLPKDGPVPGSDDAASLQAAEAFIGEIQQEIMACDLANARAMELYARSWWSKLPYFGKLYECSSTGSELVDPGDGRISEMNATAQSDHVRLERSSDAGMASVASKDQRQRLNSWFFKLRNPGWVPLIQRSWVPYFCVGCLILVWTPDVWKLRTLHWCDYKYAELRRTVHRTYWRVTMSSEGYKELMDELERGRPPPLGASKCPL